MPADHPVGRLVRPQRRGPAGARDAHEVAGRPWVFSLDPDAPGVRAALDEGGRAMTVLDDSVCLLAEGGSVDPLLPLVDVPMTCSGLSRHDVANVLAATAAGLAAGLPRARCSPRCGRSAPRRTRAA